jgi:hypothetical protein
MGPIKREADKQKVGYFYHVYIRCWKYGLTINKFRTFCTLAPGGQIGPNTRSKMTLRTPSTYLNLRGS